jgi:hypothetical protein
MHVTSDSLRHATRVVLEGGWNEPEVGDSLDYGQVCGAVCCFWHSREKLSHQTPRLSQPLDPTYSMRVTCDISGKTYP